MTNVEIPNDDKGQSQQFRPVELPDDHDRNSDDPSHEEIKHATAEIQDGWSEREEKKRRDASLEPYSFPETKVD